MLDIIIRLKVDKEEALKILGKIDAENIIVFDKYIKARIYTWDFDKISTSGIGVVEKDGRKSYYN